MEPKTFRPRPSQLGIILYELICAWAEQAQAAFSSGFIFMCTKTCLQMFISLSSSTDKPAVQLQALAALLSQVHLQVVLLQGQIHRARVQ